MVTYEAVLAFATVALVVLAIIELILAQKK